MSDRRKVFSRMMIGYNDTGKSSIAVMYANLWRVANTSPEKAKPGRCTIAGYDPQPFLSPES